MITDKQKIDILEKGAGVCKKAIDFKDELNEWSKYITQFNSNEMESLANSNSAFIALSNEMQRVSKEIEDLIS